MIKDGSLMVTYNVDIWLPDASELGYPELGETSRKVRVSLDSALKDVQEGNIEIHFEDKVYKRDDKDLNISNSSVAAISFSEDFAKKWSAKNGNVAVLAMMGGELPSQKNFFRLGFSVETIAAILGDRVINDRQVSHVLLIRVKNELGEKFEEEFKRKLEVPGQNCSLDILEIGANVTKDTKGIQSEKTENNGDGNTPTTTHTEFVTEKGGQLKVKSIIGQWLSKCIYRKEGLRSVVIYGYWDGYWDFVKEVLRCKDFNREVDWLYVESNYPLHAPFLYNVRTEGPDKQNVRTEGTDKEIDGGKQMDLFEGHIRLELEKMKDLKVSEKVYTKETKGINKRVAGEDQEVLTEDELGRVRCFTGELVEKESSFNTFAKETVHLLWDAIMVVHDQLSNSESQGLRIQLMRKGVCEFLRDCHFYKSEHLGSFFFRKDGELFFPLHHYNGNLVKQGIVRECCSKSEELTKEAVADQLRQLSDSLNKITGATTIPRNFEIEKTEDVVGVFKKFSETIAKISNGIKIDFVSNYPGTKRVFYTWPQKRDDASKEDDTKSFCHVSIFDDACKKVKGAIQINLKDSDLEDNNAFRVYVVCRRTNCFAVSTLTEWGNKQNRNERNDAKAIVFAKSRIRIPDGASEKKVCKILANYVHCQSSMAVDEFLRDFLMYRQKINEANPSANFLYYIPEYISEDNSRFTINGADGGQGGIFMTTRYKLSLFDLQIIENMVSRIFSALKTCIAEHDALRSSIKSAIGSIMSRNGSHNIGSHVLAALSHNVGTMPDDQMLYQYIQHRMDYIATATTERPTWSQPTKFVGEMIKRFLSQRHLLNFISRSEGLKAWEFQSDKAQKEGNGGRIKFHVRKVSRILQKVDSTPKSDEAKSCSKLVDDVDVVKDFIDYSEKTPAAIGLEHDVSLAIPGGVVGQHAFFTIIENIVRNAAKHDWSTPPKSTRCLKYETLNDQVDVTKLNPPGCLDVYIDYEDTPEDSDAQFVIWTRLSDVYSTDKKIVRKEVAGLTDEEVDDWLKKESLNGLPLHEHQQVELARPFIGEDGSLRRENWGMAEMKISAGYLQKAAIEAIGGIDKKGRSIITPCAVPDSWAHNKDDVNKLNDEDRKELNKVYHLGYRFNVPKSKLILFLVGERPKKLSEELEVELQRGGIYISLLENVDCSTELSYQYVVMDEFCGDTLKWMLPFRIIVTQCCDSCVESKVPVLFGQTSGRAPKKIDEYLDEVISASNGDSKKIGSRLQETICACWVRHLVSKRGFDGLGVSLRVSTKVSSQDTSSGKSLATPEDVVEFAFNEGLEKAFDTYEVACKDVKGFLVNKKIIDVLRGLKDHLVYERQSGESKKEDEKQDACDYSSYIKRQLKKWLESYIDSDPDIREAVAFLSGETSNIEELEKSTNVEMDKLDALDESSDEYKEQKRKWSDIDDKLQAARNALASPIDSLVVYLNSYCAQIQGLLSKYAEKIATLPKGFSIGAPQGEFNCVWLDANIRAWSKDAKRSVLRYWRHETKKNDSDVYLEALSGTQSYLSTLEKISNKDYPLISRLVENALLRILIIDERTREFLEKHDSMMSRFENMGIFVANDKKVDAELELLEKEYSAFEDEIKDEISSGFVNLDSRVIFDVREGYKRYENPQDAKREATETAKVRFSGKYDAIIIHQGIIDKWLPGASHDPQKVAAFIQSLKSVFRYVVITTGRGTPANIPHSARVLPFSTIQTTLFKQYPEKMILTDAIMNILPVKAIKKGVGNG